MELDLYTHYIIPASESLRETVGNGNLDHSYTYPYVAKRRGFVNLHPQNAGHHAAWPVKAAVTRTGIESYFEQLRH